MSNYLSFPWIMANTLSCLSGLLSFPLNPPEEGTLIVIFPNNLVSFKNTIHVEFVFSPFSCMPFTSSNITPFCAVMGCVCVWSTESSVILILKLRFWPKCAPPSSHWAPTPSQLVSLPSHPAPSSFHPVIPSAQLILFCDFLFLFTKGSVF